MHTIIHMTSLTGASCNAHNNKLGMEGFPLALVAENTPILELLVGGNLECIIIWKSDLSIFNYGARLRSLWQKYMLNKRLWRCFCEKIVLAAQKYRFQKKFWKILTIFLMIIFGPKIFKFFISTHPNSV